MKKFIEVKLLNGNVEYYVCETKDVEHIKEVVYLWEIQSVIVKDLEQHDLENRKVEYSTPMTMTDPYTGEVYKSILCEDYRG